jgi:hypothetical protein
MKLKTAALLGMLGCLLLLMVQVIFCISYYKTYSWYNVHNVPGYYLIFVQILGFSGLTIFLYIFYRTQDKKD